MNFLGFILDIIAIIALGVCFVLITRIDRKSDPKACWIKIFSFIPACVVFGVLVARFSSDIFVIIVGCAFLVLMGIFMHDGYIGLRTTLS